MTDFVMIGGFLGSGKTTTLLRLARGYAGTGRRVGIIANDLSEGLVDTETYRAHGLPVEEMAGMCFACRFDELIAAAGRLQDGHRPDVLLAEPAGSCTDLVSRVVEPLKKLYQDQFNVAPYVTLLDPHRARTALTGKGPAAFSAKVTYLYKMQQNEADIVAINKADLLSPGERAELRELVARNFLKAEVMLVSARTGEGFDHLLQVLDENKPTGRNAVPFDECEDPLAEADAALGWVNGTWRVSAGEQFEMDRLLLDLAGAIQRGLRWLDSEPAHVKMTLRAGDRLALANLVSSDRPAELSRASGARAAEATLIVNARVEIDPAELRECMELAVRRTMAGHQADATCVAITELTPDLLSTSCRLDNSERRTG